MIIQLCKKSIARLGTGTNRMVSALREQDHTVSLKDCLDRCQGCDQGLIIATVAGMPVSAETPSKLLEAVSELADAE